MNKKHVIGAVAVGVLAGTAFAAQLSLGGLGKSLGDTTYQIGYLIGSFIALGAIVIPSMSLGKDQSGSTTTFLSQDTLKYIIPALFIASAAGTFFGSGTDYGSVATQAIADGLFHWMWIGFLIQAVRGMISETGGGIFKGVSAGLESRVKDAIKGEEHDEEHKKAKKLVDSMKYMREIGANSNLSIDKIYTSPAAVTQYMDFLNRVRQQHGVP